MAKLISFRTVLSFLAGALVACFLTVCLYQLRLGTSPAPPPPPPLHFAYVRAVDAETGKPVSADLVTVQPDPVLNSVIDRNSPSGTWLIIVAGPLPSEVSFAADGYQDTTVPFYSQPPHVTRSSSSLGCRKVPMQKAQDRE